MDSLEIYIPLEAEVKSIPLSSLPNSVLRRMGLLLSESDSRTLTDSPEGIWICPAVIRRKGQKPASPTGNGVNMSSLLGRDPGPFQMSFVSANHTAYRVLKNTMPGKKVSADTSHTPLLPQGSAPQTYKDGLVIYHGRIYLSSRKPSQSRSQQETHEPQAASHSSISKKHNKRQSAQASLEPANKERQRKKVCVTLPQTSPQQQKDLLTKTDTHSTTGRKLPNDNKKKPTTCKVTHSKNKKGRDVSSSKSANSVPPSTAIVHKVDSHRPEDTDGVQAAEEAAGTEPAWFQSLGEQQQQEVANNDAGECETQVLGGEESDYLQIDSGEPEHIVGIVEQSSTVEGAACASTSLQDSFEWLAEEERISLMRAKLRLTVAAVKNLPSSS